MSANQYSLFGAYLTSDPEERLAGETPLVEFTVVDNAWNEKRYLPKFVAVTCSGKMADTARQLRKGDQVSVSGRLDVRTFEGKDRKTRLAFQIERPTTLTPHVDLRARASAPEDLSSATPDEPQSAPTPNSWDT